MKAKVITKKEFQPIVIKLTIESEQELCDLWHRLEIGTNTIKDSMTRHSLKYKMDNNLCNEVYQVINQIVEQHNLKI